MDGIFNARIAKTFLGLEDHGILTTYLTLEWQSSGQAFGGWYLDQHSVISKERLSKAWLAAFIKRTIEIAGADSWEALTGKYVRAECAGGLLVGIGHITEDKWLYPKQLMAEIDEVVKSYV